MSRPIAAIYENGVFRPLEPLDLPERSEVALQIIAEHKDAFLELIGAFSSEQPLIDGIAVSEDPDLYLVAAAMGERANGQHAWEIMPAKYRRGENNQPIRIESK